MNLKEINVDLNTLFSFNFNFDSLKLLLENMNNNQSEMIAKINELDTIVNNNKKKFCEGDTLFNKKMSKSSSKYDKMELEVNKEEDEIEPRDKDTIEENKECPNNDNQNQLEEEEEEKDNNVNSLGTQQNIDQESLHKSEDSTNFPKNTDIRDLKKRIEMIEKSIKHMSYSKSSSPNQQESLMFLQHKGRFNTDSDNITKQMKEMNDKLISLSLTFNEMSVKVNEFNLDELLKECRTNGESGGGGIDVSKSLVMNLEQKVFKKFSFVDEKNKQILEEQFKINKTINDTKMQMIQNDVLIAQLQKQLLLNNESMLGISNNLDTNNLNLNEKLNKQQKSINESNNEVKKINESINQLIDRIDIMSKENKNSASVLNENDLQLIKDLLKRVIDLERNLRTLGQSVNLDVIKDDIRKLKGDLQQKSNSTDIFDIDDKVNFQASVIERLKDITEKLIDDRNKLCSDSNLMMKKVESLNAAVLSMKASEESNSLINKANVIDTSKYLEISIFNDFLKLNMKEQDKLIREDDDLRRSINEISSSLKTKAAVEDIKNMELCLIARLEEMKLFIFKKFADKNETSKNLKYLDTQLKHIIDYYVKKNDKGDSWLLAKKPIGGFSCASCETYIGELPDKKDYLVWNKYPMRDSQDKAYRIGNGYSKLLGMLNVDIKNPIEGISLDNQSDSDNEAKNNQSNLTKRSQHLPNIAKNKIDEHANLSIDLNDDIAQKTIDPNEPKVVRIVKRSKNHSMDLSRNGK